MIKAGTGGKNCPKLRIPKGWQRLLEMTLEKPISHTPAEQDSCIIEPEEGQT